MKMFRRLLIGLLAGAFIGFFSVYGLLDFQSKNLIARYGREITITISSLSFILVVLTHIYLRQIKKRAALSLSAEEEDLRDGWQYRKYSYASLSANLSSITAIFTLSFAFITKQSTGMILTALLPFLLTLPSSSCLFSVVRTIYPDRQFPRPSEKNYTKKLLAISDEGERHVMLEGFFFAFNRTNFLLFSAIVILTLYSLGTGDSQLFSIFMIGLVLAAVNTEYIFRVKNK